MKVSMVTICEVRFREKQQRTNQSGQKQKEMDCDEPISHRMKKCRPSSGQNGQLVHWWLLVHSGPSSRPTTSQAPILYNKQ